ncbi:O-antigen biosynthesis protein [Paracidovorax avenae]|nr:O-antigen biosynthesis protein [Paracidovorax avenae]
MASAPTDLFTCPVCGNGVTHFLPVPDHYASSLRKHGASFSMSDFETLNTAHYSCPACMASDRDRLYAYFIRRHLLRPSLPQLRILDIAPAPALSSMLRGLGGRNYRSADLQSPLADDRVDITDMRIYADDSFDLIICSHVLEHVNDDQLAMRELHRVLAPGGCAILMVPLLATAATTDEDPQESRVEERWRRFGQDDHVRLYAKKDFIGRLQHAGFAMASLTQDDLGAAAFSEHGISARSVLHIGRKPAEPGCAHPSWLLRKDAEDGVGQQGEPDSASSVQVTVAIPAYKATYLDAALQSALAQEFDSFEIVVCDDSRGDAVEKAVTPYLCGSAQPRTSPVAIRYFKNPEPLGEEGNVGKCIRLARGAYIKFLYDDDILLPGCLRTLADVLDRHDDVSLVSSRRQVIDEQGRRHPDIAATQYPFNGDVLIEGGDLVSLLADWTVNFIGEPSTVMVRREHVLPLAGRQFSLENEPVYWLGDVTMHVQLLRLGHLALLQAPLSCLRISNEQTSHLGRLHAHIGRERYAYFSRTLKQLGWVRATNNQFVRVTPLALPGMFDTVDLGTRLERMQSGAPPLVDALGPWLSARMPCEAQLQLMKSHLQTVVPAPSVHIFVRDAQGDSNQVAATLHSLEALRLPGLALQATVLARAPGPARPGVEHVEMQSLAEWPAIANRQVAAAGSGWLLFVEAGEVFTPHGLWTLLLEAGSAPQCRAIYADELVDTGSGSLGTLFRPDFNLDLLLSCPQGMARHWLFRRDAFLQADGFDPQAPGAAELDLILRLIMAEGIECIGHVSEPLLVSALPQLSSRPDEITAIARHLHARGYVQARVDANLPGRYRVHYGHEATPSVSIIIPTKDQFAMVERCVSSLLEKTAYQNYEIILVDNGSTDPSACAWIGGLEAMDDPRIRVLRYPHPFNYSAINNAAARVARGEYLILLNNDTATLRGDWLDAMLNHAQRPEVGIVGAKLLHADGTIQHGGVVLGLRGPADHPFIGLPADAPGYMNRLEVDQNYSAVTAACLMIRRSVYEEVGGLDEEAFKVSYNDVDLCLKVRQAGYLIVWTPHAVVLHEGSVSQKSVDVATQEAKRARFMGEQDAMYQKWLPVVARDPAYNPNLSLHGTGFDVETDAAINRRPLPWRPQPVVLALAADHSGCGHYRVIEPVRAMHGSGIADARFASRYFTPEELHRLQPDTLVLQRQVNEEQLQLIQRIQRLCPVFMVAELDDYLPNLPLKNTHRQEMPKDVLRQLRRSVGMMDRFVVSTDALAEALKGIHPDMRVVQNRLPPRWWRGLQGSRQTGGRPRVGWAGGISHQGDLELITDVVKELHREVDWIFFGMCPDRIKPYVREYHGPVSIERYPAMLASLNLDLALAPLEQNLFNECKSNLRLLEYGACGYPVIASDARPYQCGLPVTLVKNRFKDWVDAIRAHVHDPAAAARSGDALRAAVERDWMLEGAHLQNWLRAWLPE